MTILISSATRDSDKLIDVYAGRRAYLHKKAHMVLRWFTPSILSSSSVMSFTEIFGLIFGLKMAIFGFRGLIFNASLAVQVSSAERVMFVASIAVLHF